MSTPIIISGSAHPDLARQICERLEVRLSRIESRPFNDGERFIKIEENVRGRDVFVIQPTCAPCNENLMELLLIIDALRRASADRITAVIPYFGYSRQDRKEQGRVPISAKLVANLLTTAGASRIVTIDLHVGQIQGFFDIPVDHLYAITCLSDYVMNMNIPEAVVLSPDIGNVKRARSYAERLNLPLAIIDKRRPRPNASEVMNVIGAIEGRNALIFDDIIDTAGTLLAGAEAVKSRGAKDIYACCTHAVFSGEARRRLQDSPIKKVIVTDTIPQRNGDDMDKLEIVSIAPLLADAITRIHGKRRKENCCDTETGDSRKRSSLAIAGRGCERAGLSGRRRKRHCGRRPGPARFL
jgi:ribose-phosphate pyrophosphokinase